jgi:unsaturated rhamnogalacturonyl hydrolase
VAQRGRQALLTTVSRYQDGGPQINSFAPGKGVQVDYAAYVAIGPVSVPLAEGKHHPHGYMGALMAASVMEK